MAKYLYIKYKDKDIKSDFYKELYHKHLITFNGCYELPDSTIPNCGITKSCIEDYLKAFDDLIDDIKKNGFNKQYPIPLGSNDIIINGAHRLMISYYYSITPQFEKKNSCGCDVYNYIFFLKRHSKPCLDRLYTDTIALEYIKHNASMRCMILYPVAYDKQKNIQLYNIIKQYGYIYYHKEVTLNSNGVNNLIKELYREENWIGGLFPGMGSKEKHRLCFANNPIIYISISMLDVSKCIELKDKCRAIYGLGKHSLHMSDYISDTLRISSALLNDNSIHFLNNGTNDICLQTQYLLTDYFKEIKEKNDNKEDYCLTSSLIMEMYNLRQAKDIDYLHKDNKKLILNNTGIHDGKWETYYHIHKDEIIYNPHYHFYFNGFKFATLNVIKRMKEKRKECKDLLDIEIINNKLNLKI
tara:strand:+ start:2168 stop:3406 length:1239 start_codon:yes stop_codon:yes gene_type:complete